MAANPDDDYSPAATLITFDRPIPLLRQPTLAGKDENSVVLAFKDRQSFESAYEFSKSNIFQQCSAGARIGCSVTASRNCAPPWWKKSKFPIIGGGRASKEELLMEREKCEEREMAECLEASRISCLKFAEEKCLPVFRDARIVVGGGGGGGKVKRCVAEMVSRVWWMGGKSKSVGGGVELWKLESRIGVSVVRGSDLMEKRF